MKTTADFISEECDALKSLLLAKNKAYGDAAINPLRIFSKESVDAQIRVRLDDKLSRLARGSAAGEDVELDLMGYLVLLRVSRAKGKAEEPRFDPGNYLERPVGNPAPDPGAGYRLLSLGETIASSDQHWLNGVWEQVGPGAYGVTLHFGHLPIRRRVEPTVDRGPVPNPGFGYRLLNVGEGIQKEDEWSDGEEWKRTGASGLTVLPDNPNYYRRRQECPDRGERKGAPVE